MSLSPDFFIDENSREGENSPRNHEVTAKKKFHLSSVASPLTHSALTSLPTKEKVLLLDNLAPGIALKIRNCLKNIYSHVTERKPSEGEEYFYHAVASSAFYENFHGEFIKDADHTKKAGSLLPNIKETIDEINAALPRLINPAHEPILKMFRSILCVHYNAVLKAIRTASPATIVHLQIHQGLDLEITSLIPLTDEEKHNVKGCFEKGPGTPVKLSTNDKLVIPLLSAFNPSLYSFLRTETPSSFQPKRLDFTVDPSDDKNAEFLRGTVRLDEDVYDGFDFEDSDNSNDEKETGSEEDSDPDQYDFNSDDELIDPAKDEMDDLLSQQMDALIFGGPKLGVQLKSAVKHVPEVEVKKGKNKRK